MVVFMLKGKPQGKGRPRVTMHGTYTPRKTVAYENAIRAAYPGGYFTGAVMLKVMAFFAPPKSTSKKKRAEMLGRYYTHKPDGDNVLKIVKDALNGIAYNDDAQVVDEQCCRFYGTEDAVVVMLQEVEIRS